MVRSGLIVLHGRVFEAPLFTVRDTFSPTLLHLFLLLRIDDVTAASFRIGTKSADAAAAAAAAAWFARFFLSMVRR